MMAEVIIREGEPNRQKKTISSLKDNGKLSNVMDALPRIQHQDTI
jgi:hypothetical protein